MKKFFLFATLQLFSSTCVFSQNLLSPIWKINFTNTSEKNLNQINPTSWKDVNLLLSWERQGYFWNDGNGSMANEFSVPDELTGSKLILSVSLQFKSSFLIFYIGILFIKFKRKENLKLFYGGLTKKKEIIKRM